MTDSTGNGQVVGPRGPRRSRSMILLAAMLVGLPLAFVVSGVLRGPWRTAGSVRALDEAGVVYLRATRVFLVDTDAGPLALSATSPHLGDRIAFCEPSETFVELGHGGLFDREGRYLSGPPQRGMDRVAVRVSDGRIEIDPETVTPGPARSVVGEQPTGRLCGSGGLREIRPGFVVPR